MTAIPATKAIYTGRNTGVENTAYRFIKKMIMPVFGFSALSDPK